VFAETTHVVAAPPSFAWVVPALTWLYFFSFIEIHSGVLKPHGLKIALLHWFGYCLIQQLGITVQAVTGIVQNNQQQIEPVEC